MCEVMSAKILLVDDSGLARRSTRRILEGAGYTVVEAEDGLSALEQFAVERPDLVLLDLLMKGMYGLDVLRKLRQMDPTARVIIVSADIQDLSQEMVQAAGAAGLLNKPAEPAEVIDMVGQIISRSAPWS
jgi:two-component system, chemotaxis family, chemotaxis protein CheY